MQRFTRLGYYSQEKATTASQTNKPRTIRVKAASISEFRLFAWPDGIGSEIPLPSPPRYEPRSFYNPYGYSTNCLFVTLGRLLFMSANSFAILTKQPMPISTAYPWSEIPNLLKITAARFKYTYRTYDMKLSPQNVRNLIGGEVFGVVYMRKDGTGHCVTIRKTMMNRQHPRGLEYRCYQQLTEGEDMTYDAEEARIGMLFGFRTNSFVYIGNPCVWEEN